MQEEISNQCRTELDLKNEVKRQPVKGTIWITDHQSQAWRMLGTAFRNASHRPAQKILAILCRA